ncbi:acyltransferase family protein [Paremcibacter congregatus]|uniref:acyltransferase family protein n=1 Tax=Paremcibacter congregatus TaxID=2043170 RepID=UPI003A8F786F
MRHKQIDLLRFLGLSLIILAHIEPPEWLFRLRNFDVPMMVLVAGLSFAHSTGADSYLHYVWKRIKRLLLPVWIFLTVYFLVIWTFGLDMEVLSLDRVVESYSLHKGIGYVWIIRIFLLVALAAPFILKLDQKIASNRTYLLVLAAFYLGYEFLLHFTEPYAATPSGKLISLYLYYGICYSLVFALGVRFQRFTVGEFCLIFVAACLVHGSFGYIYYLDVGEIISTQETKYPPSAYYIFYAILVSVVLWKASPLLVKGVEMSRFVERTVMFVAQNSLWIYLWHIPFVSGLRDAEMNSFEKYLLVYSGALLMMAIQFYSVKYLLLPGVKSAPVRKNLKGLLTG